jgi:hypothetical protein
VEAPDERSERLSGRVEQRNAFCLAAAGKEGIFANDSSTQNWTRGWLLMRKRTYITATRVAALRAELRPIDLALLADVHRLNVVSGRQLHRLHYQPSETGRRMARLDFQRLVERRVLARLGRSVGGRRAGSEGFVYALGVAGQRLIRPEGERPREPWTPISQNLRHDLAVSQLYVQLRQLEREGRTELEHFDAEPVCWRPFHGLGGGREMLKPDAYVVTATSDYTDSWFIEMDRSTEPTTRIADKLKAYSRYRQSGREQANRGVFPLVLFVVPDERRRRQLSTVVNRLPPDESSLFRVVTADRAAHAMTTGQLININQVINEAKEVTS